MTDLAVKFQAPKGYAPIQTREPTGIVPWPLILVEGEEKSGKSYTAALLTASERVGDSFWVDLGEGAADEYASIGNYQVVVHDGTWRSWFEQVKSIHAYAAQQAKAGKKPVVLVIDTATAEWEWLKDWIGGRAAQSKLNKKILADDPNAEVKIPNHLWNEANAKHRNLMRLLMSFEGICILTARGKEVAVIRDGRPVEGEKQWKPETQKDLPYDVTAWITMKRDAGAVLTGARSIYIGQKPGQGKPMAMPEQWDEGGLEWFIFEGLRCNPEATNARQMVELDRSHVDDGLIDVEAAMTQMREGWQDSDALRRIYDAAEQSNILGAQIDIPNQGTQAVGDMLATRIRFLIDQQEAAQQPDTPEAPAAQDNAQEAAQDARTEPEAAPAQQDEAPAQEAAQEPPAQHDQPSERKLTKAEQRTAQQEAWIREELQFQADALGADMGKLFERISVDGKVHLGRAQRAIVGARPMVITALREVGSATVADRYEAIKEGFPINIALVTDEPETADAAQEASA